MIPSYARYWWPMNEPPLEVHHRVQDRMDMREWLPWELYPTLPRED